MADVAVRPTGSRVAWLTALTMAVSAVVGCNGDPSPSSSPGVSQTFTDPPSSERVEGSPPPSPTSPEDAAHDAAIAAYLGMWADFAVAAETSDWQSPELAGHATGEALSVLSRGLYADHYNGLVSKGEPELDPEVSSMDPPGDPSTVVVADCGDSSNWLRYDAETGELADDEPGGRRAITATVEKQPDGVWKVTGFAVEAVGTC